MSPLADERLIARQVLEWHLAAGADEAFDELPHDRFAEGRTEREARNKKPAAPVPEARPAEAPRHAPVHLSTEAAQQRAEAVAAGAQTLSELEAAMRAFDGCALKSTATQMVVSSGNPKARIVMIGDGPDAEDDRAGTAFSGRTGQLLDRMLTAIGLDRSSVFLANLVPWRPPGNRPPTAQEIAVCLPFVRRQIALSEARFLVCLGVAPCAALLQQKETINRMRGRWFDYGTGERTLKALVTLPPSFLINAPLSKRNAWRDLQDLQRALAE